MNMNLRDVIKNRNALEALGKLSLPAKLSFAIKRNLDILQREAVRIEEQRVELCRRYADKGTDGEPLMVESVANNKKVEEFKLSDENMKEFAREYADLLGTEIDADIRTVKMELIEQCETSERYSIPTVEQLAGMDFMIEE